MKRFDFNTLVDPLKAIGTYLVANPTAAFFIAAFTTIVLPIIVALTDVFGMLYHFDKTSLPQSLQSFSPEIEYSHGYVQRLINIIGALSLSLICGFANALFVLFGLLERSKEREAQNLLSNEDLGNRIGKATEGVATTLSVSIRGALDKIAEDILTLSKREFQVFFPLQSNMINDDAIRAKCIEVARVVSEEMQDHPQEQRIIVKSLIDGFLHRLKDISDHLSEDGFFMDVVERRTLTANLVEHSAAYSVILFGPDDIIQGPMHWHEEYVSFVRQAKLTTSDNLCFVFVLDASTPKATQEAAIQSVKSLGVRCHIVELHNSGAVINKADMRAFVELGHMIEVFSTGFCRAINEGTQIPKGEYVAWKATDFRLRSGSKLSPQTATRLSVADAVEQAVPEGVWASEEVAKLIRAGATRISDDPVGRALNYIARNAKRLDVVGS